MSRLSIVCLVACAMALPSQAPALDWSLGAHLGAAVVSSDVEGSGNSSLVALSSNVLSYQPSLRVAVGTERHAHDLSFDTGLFVLDEGGVTLRLMVGMINYQWTARPRWGTSPFVNAGLGLYHEGSELRASTSGVQALGIGVRHVVRDEHGALRAEFRWERLGVDHDVGRPTLTTLGVRLGFDLWM